MDQQGFGAAARRTPAGWDQVSACVYGPLARHARLAEWTPPEITEARISAWSWSWPTGVSPDPASCSGWTCRPGTWQQAVGLLRQLGALRCGGTYYHDRAWHGAFSRTPAPGTRAGIGGRQANQAVAAEVAALLSERDPLGRAPMQQHSADIGSHRCPGRAAWTQPVADPASMRRRCAESSGGTAVPPAECTAAPGEDGSGSGCGEVPGVGVSGPGGNGCLTDGRRYLMRNGRAALLDEPTHYAAVRSLRLRRLTRAIA